MFALPPRPTAANPYPDIASELPPVNGAAATPPRTAKPPSNIVPAPIPETTLPALSLFALATF